MEEPTTNSKFNSQDWASTWKFADGDDVESFAKQIDEGTKAIYAEAMGNPRFNIPDFEGLSALAKKHGFP